MQKKFVSNPTHFIDMWREGKKIVHDKSPLKTQTSWSYTCVDEEKLKRESPYIDAVLAIFKITPRNTNQQ